mmetsp:Transcript_24388/g.43268  ORF Transcript_24388/g.43268 Transcript_24388/m.43268 type:complete len:571 (-) Transcript_24388:315-2027(-)|eukprot:CAMPEP_0197522722 /NCGR_PEP_ID=MMETSP1318-20131121/7811_1 /TAXON_ID=552666 /ORGANISM="Partenskyella glossopodia, Strain RCC365" /LENGTH=570 /DNA_ID=CAMNT_0043075187 /DNA_START=146 /DNA_END=1858 /DNA_ORIENTATION=-
MDKKNIPTANATLVAKNQFLYPLMPLQSQSNDQAVPFTIQSDQNMALLQNYLASQYILDPKLLNCGTSSSVTTVPAAAACAPAIHEDGGLQQRKEEEFASSEASEISVEQESISVGNSTPEKVSKLEMGSGSVLKGDSSACKSTAKNNNPAEENLDTRKDEVGATVKKKTAKKKKSRKRQNENKGLDAAPKKRAKIILKTSGDKRAILLQVRPKTTTKAPLAPVAPDSRQKGQKRQKMSLKTNNNSDATSKKRANRTPQSPAAGALTPRRKQNGGDLLGFVSLSLPVPRDISAEWEQYKKEIITPKWQQKSLTDVKIVKCDTVEEEEPSSEEDTSDETYYAWHRRSHERDCQRIRKVLESAPHNKNLAPKSKPKPKKQAKEEQPSSSIEGLAQPLTYNYSIHPTTWTKPADYIKFVDPSKPQLPERMETPTAEVKSDDSAETKPKLPNKPPVQRKRKRRRNSAKESSKKESSKKESCKKDTTAAASSKKDATKDKGSQKNKETSADSDSALAAMRKQYLALQAQLNRLKGKKDAPSRLKWKAAVKTGKNGKRTNVIRLKRMPKRNPKCAA